MSLKLAVEYATGLNWTGFPPTEKDWWFMDDLDKTLAERGKTHGDWEAQASLSQQIKRLFHGADGWVRLSPMQRETLDMYAVKVSRILTGDPNEPDHWKDLAGYQKITGDRLA